MVRRESINNKDKFKMPKWMECAWRRISCGKDDCPICGRIKRDRQRRIERGEDPNDLKCVFEDVGQNFKEALQMVKKDAERMGIDITNIDNIQEPPEPEKFPFYKKVMKWREEVLELAESAEATESFWLFTEAAADLFWYANTLAAKTYRQLCNRWHIKEGDDYGDHDYQYTKYVLKECLKILKKSLGDLSQFDSPQKPGLLVILIRLGNLEKQILKI